MKTAHLLSKTDKAPNDFQFNFAISTYKQKTSMVVGSDGVLSISSIPVCDTLIEAMVTLNVYLDKPEVKSAEGQILYHWDDDEGSTWEHLQLALDAYKASEFGKQYPLVL